MKSLNVVYLLGNVGKDPEVNELNGKDGTIKVASFSLATSEGGYTRRDGTQVEEKTQWHRVYAWRGLAEVTQKYIHKGDKVLVIGHVEYREVLKPDGTKMFFTDIVADDLNLLTPIVPQQWGQQPYGYYPQQQMPTNGDPF